MGGGERFSACLAGRIRDSWCNTRTSQEVTHPSTTLAQACLTSEFCWDPVHSCWYDRTRQGLRAIRPYAPVGHNLGRCTGWAGSSGLVGWARPDRARLGPVLWGVGLARSGCASGWAGPGSVLWWTGSGRFWSCRRVGQVNGFGSVQYCGRQVGPGQVVRVSGSGRVEKRMRGATRGLPRWLPILVLLWPKHT